MAMLQRSRLLTYSVRAGGRWLGKSASYSSPTTSVVESGMADSPTPPAATRPVASRLTASQDSHIGQGTQSRPQRSRVYLLNRQRLVGLDLELPEALRALRAYSLSEIPETVEISLRVDLTLKKGKKRDTFRGTLMYPHPFGQQQTVLVCAEESYHDVARSSGADIVGGDDLIAKMEAGAVDFDVCVTTPLMYKKILKLQQKLRAKMPNPRRGTVTEEIPEIVAKLKCSKEFKTDKNGYINMPVGKLDFHDDQVATNVRALVEAVSGFKGNLQKTQFFQRAILSTTYGPGFPLTISDYL